MSELDPNFNYTKENIYTHDDYLQYKKDTDFDGSYLEWLELEYNFIETDGNDYGELITILKQKIDDLKDNEKLSYKTLCKTYRDRKHNFCINCSYEYWNGLCPCKMRHILEKLEEQN